MKKLCITCLSVLFFVGFFLIVGGTPHNAIAAAPGKQVILKQSMVFPVSHFYTIELLKFSQKVAKVTNDRVKIEVFPSSTLCPANQELAAVHAGTIDMSYSPSSYLGGRVPISQYASLPWFAPTTRKGAIEENAEIVPILNNAIKAYNVRVLSIHGVPGTYVLVGRKEIRTPADVKGLKIRSGGGLMDKMAYTWGAGVVSLPVSESYESLQKGVVDLNMGSISSIKGMKFYEVAPYMTDLDMGLNSFFMFINKDKWNQISPKDQKAILESIPEFVGESFDNTISDIKAVRSQLTGFGMKVYKPTPVELKQWKASAKPLWEDFSKSSPEAQQLVNILKKYGGGVD